MQDLYLKESNFLLFPPLYYAVLFTFCPVFCEFPGRLLNFGQQSLCSTAAKTEKGEDSLLKWFLLLIPATTFGLGTWQVEPVYSVVTLKTDHADVHWRWTELNTLQS